MQSWSQWSGGNQDTTAGHDEPGHLADGHAISLPGTRAAKQVVSKASSCFKGISRAPALGAGVDRGRKTAIIHS